MLNNELSLQLAKITQPFGVLTQMKLFIRRGGRRDSSGRDLSTPAESDR